VICWELHNEEIQGMVLVIISRKMGGGGRDAWRTRQKRAAFWLENLKERGHLGDMDVDVRTVLKWILV
jgi:hypothetical protein